MPDLQGKKSLFGCKKEKNIEGKVENEYIFIAPGESEGSFP